MSRVLRDVAVVGSLVIVVVPAAAWLGSAVREGVDEVLTLAAVAVGAGAATLADLSSRLRGPARFAWCGAALAVYSLVLISSTTLAPDGPVEAAGLQVAQLIAYVTVLVLLLLAVRPSERGGVWGGWAVAAGGSALALVVGQLVTLGPPRLLGNVLDPALGLIVLTGWCWVGAVYVQRGIATNRSPLWRIGIGVGVLAGGQIYRVAGTDPADPDVVFAALRLLGLAVIAVAIAGLWLYVVRDVRANQERRADELRRVVAQLEQVVDADARRDHELRNGIGGLLGITTLLSSPQDGRRAQLRSAVLAELTRLTRMVAHDGAPESTAGVTTVLTETAVLQAARGMPVSAAADPDLRAEIPDDVLRQILANLLANAELHAPGAAVELGGWADGGIVVVMVRDDGPGVPAGSEEAVFAAGARTVAHGGSGLGLHISRELVIEHGGTLSIKPSDPAQPGCTVVLTLVRAVPDAPVVGLPPDLPDDHGPQARECG